MNLNVAALYKDYSEYAKCFNSKQYKNAFELYQKECKEFLQQCDVLFAEKEDFNSFISYVSTAVISYALALKSEKHFIRKNAENVWQEEMNLFAVAYLFPLILECRNDYYKQLTDSIVEMWPAMMNTSKISAESFEMVNMGFHKKFLGLF